MVGKNDTLFDIMYCLRVFAQFFISIAHIMSKSFTVFIIVFFSHIVGNQIVL